MLNILATEEKKKILIEYRLRLGVISVFAVAALVFASLVLLAPSYLLAVSKYNNAKNELATLEEKYGGTGKEKDVATQIRDINNKIALLSGGDTGDRLSPPQVSIDILKTKSKAIKIYGFTYDATTNQERIVLTGIAANRDSMANFIETLKKDAMFTNVTLPISSYVKSTDIDFSVVLEHSHKTPKK